MNKNSNESMHSCALIFNNNIDLPALTSLNENELDDDIKVFSI